MYFSKLFKGLPFEYESFLIEKYDSFITTCRYIQIYYSTYDVNYFIVYDNSIIKDVFVFGNKANTSQIFNSLVEIDEDIIVELIKNIFDKCPFIRKVFIDASYAQFALKHSISLCKSDDYILNLPLTMDDFYFQLGYHTRKNIKNRKVRLQKDYQTVNCVTKYGQEIEKTLIEKIVQLNCDRLKHKGIKPGKYNSNTDNIFKYSIDYGCVSYLEIDGKIVAGCISTIVNKAIFIHVIAFDNNYAKNNVGEICVFQLIQTSIEKGLKTIHFLWGKTELKKRLLAKPHLLFSYLIFKSHSLDYMMHKFKTIWHLAFIQFKQSKYSLPFRHVIKSIEKKIYKIG